MSDSALACVGHLPGSSLSQPLPNTHSHAHAAATLRFRTRVLKDDAIPVGPGKIELLNAVGECHSLSAAAKSLGMSYRRAWLLIDEMNRTLKEPVVRSATGGVHGGGSVLTDFGRELVALYAAIERSAYEACKADIHRLLSMVRQEPPAG